MKTTTIKNYKPYLFFTIAAIIAIFIIKSIVYPEVKLLDEYNFNEGEWTLKKGNYWDSVQYIITDPNALNKLKDTWVLNKSIFEKEKPFTTGGYVVDLYRGTERVLSMDIEYGSGPGELWCPTHGGVLSFGDMNWLESGPWNKTKEIRKDFASTQKRDEFLDSLNKIQNYRLLWSNDKRIDMIILK
jgi:hypothetical protein